MIRWANTASSSRCDTSVRPSCWGVPGWCPPGYRVQAQPDAFVQQIQCVIQVCVVVAAAHIHPVQIHALFFQCADLLFAHPVWRPDTGGGLRERSWAILTQNQAPSTGPGLTPGRAFSSLNEAKLPVRRESLSGSGDPGWLWGGTTRWSTANPPPQIIRHSAPQNYRLEAGSHSPGHLHGPRVLLTVSDPWCRIGSRHLYAFLKMVAG